MTGISRRAFLTGVGASSALAAAGFRVYAWRRDEGAPATASSTTASTTTSTTTPEVSYGIPGRTLVLLELGGGNDALSMVVPHADGRYHDLRPALAVTDPIDLDGSIGLSPRLTTLASEYHAGRVAIIEGVGMDNPDLSHFESLNRWWTGDTPETTATGWLGRYLDGAVGFDDPLAGIAIGTGPSPALSGTASFATAIADASGLQPGRLGETEREAVLAAWSTMVPDRLAAGMLGDVQRAITETLDARTRLASMLQSAGPRRGAARLPVSDALALAVRLAAADDPPRAVVVQGTGDFDTHQSQVPRHDALMQALDAGVSSFVVTAAELGVSDRVVLATTSEFGRRARENGTGTDHGTAAAHVVLGAGVHGGRYGEPPSLVALDDSGNLVPTVQLHDYYATLLSWLGVDGAPVLARPVNPLQLFAA